MSIKQKTSMQIKAKKDGTFFIISEDNKSAIGPIKDWSEARSIYQELLNQQKLIDQRVREEFATAFRAVQAKLEGKLPNQAVSQESAPEVTPSAPKKTYTSKKAKEDESKRSI